MKRSQAVVATGSLLVGALVSSTLLNLYSDVRRKMSHEFAAYGPNAVLAPAQMTEQRRVDTALAAYTAEPWSSEWRAKLIDEDVLRRLELFRQKVNGLTAAPVLYVVVRVNQVAQGRVGDHAPAADTDNAVVVGTDFAALRRLNPNWRFQGAAEGLEPRACAVGAHLAALLHLGVGDAIQIQTLEYSGGETELPSLTLSISGILSSGASEDDQIFVPLGTLQQLAGLPGKISLVQLNFAGEPAEIEREIGALASLLPGLEVRPVRQIVYSEGRVLGTLRWLLASLTALILVITGLCVMATVTSIVLERRKDIAVMKALGATDREVMRLFLSEVAVAGLVGGVTGSMLGILVARDLGQRLFGVSLNLTAWTLPAVWLATTALAVLAGLLPVRLVRSVQPATILKGE